MGTHTDDSQDVARPSPPMMLATRVRDETYRRVNDAARDADQPVAAWLRMAIMEKLDRDEDWELVHGAGN